MSHAQFLEPVILEISLDRVELCHRIADRCAGGENDAAASGQLVHVTALGEHIRRLLCVGGGKTSHISHFGVEEQVFVIVRLVHEQPVNAELLECDHIILAAFALELFQAGFQRALRFFHLLDRIAGAVIVPHFLNAGGNVFDLLLQEPDLPFGTDGNTLKLTVADDHGVIIAGGNTGTKLLSVGRLKVPLGRNKDICRGIEA